MTSAEYRIESNCPVTNRLLPQSGISRSYHDMSQAVAVAAKCVPDTFGGTSGCEVRVVHVPSGEIVFRTVPADSGPRRVAWNDFDPG